MNCKYKGVVSMRNKDVEHIVNAAANLGYYAYGIKQPKRFAMLVMADIHRCPKQLHNAVEYLNEMEALDAGICLGDMQGGNYAENDGTWYSLALEWAEKPFYTVVGNHDGGNSKKREISATKGEVYNKFIRRTRHKMNMPELDKTYYSTNFDEYKLTLIVLDDYMAPDVLDENGNFRIHRGAECMNQEELDWLVDTLNNVPEGYHVMIARHAYPDAARRTDCSFTQPARELSAPMPTTYGKCGAVPDIVNAWIHGSSISKEYAPIDNTDILPTLSVHADFSKRGKGDFVAYLVGHFHCSYVGRSDTYPEQNIIVFPTAANDDWQNAGCDLPRERGTKAEDLLTVFAVDRDERVVHLVRVGSNFTKHLVDRTYYSIEY